MTGELLSRLDAAIRAKPDDANTLDLLVDARGALQLLADDIREHEHSFELRWAADQRAIARWQTATGRAFEWPDHADLVVWLLNRIDELEQVKHAHETEAAAKAANTGR